MVRVRKSLEKLWKGTCAIYVNQEIVDPITKRSSFKLVSLYSNQPCKLSNVSITTTNPNNNAFEVTQKTKLFISPELGIPAGCKIVVTQNSKTTEYERSGEPYIFTNHQEIMLDLFKGWS